MSISISVTVTPSVKLTRPDEKNLKVPPNGRFFQVWHPWQLASNNYKPIQINDPEFEQPNLPMPAPKMLYGCEKKPTAGYQQIHPTWQWRNYELYRLMVGLIPEDGEIDYWYTGGEGLQPYTKVPAGTLHANPRFKAGTLLDAYSHIWEDHRASSDGASYNTTNFWGRDEVMKCHLENPNTWRAKCLTWCGSLLQEYVNPPGPVPSDCWAIRTWDYTKPAPPMEVLLAPDAPPLWWGTEQSVEQLRDENGKLVLWGGRPSYKVAHYPWLKLVCRKYGLKPEVGTPFFPIGIDGWNLVKKADVRQLPNNQSYSPYWPG